MNSKGGLDVPCVVATDVASEPQLCLSKSKRFYDKMNLKGGFDIPCVVATDVASEPQLCLLKSVVVSLVRYGTISH